MAGWALPSCYAALGGRGRGDGRAGSGDPVRAAGAAQGVQHHCAHPQPGGVHRHRPVGGAGHRLVHAGSGPQPQPRRLPGRRAVVRFGVPARTGSTDRAVQGAAAGPVLHCGGHGHRPRPHRRRTVADRCRRRHPAGGQVRPAVRDRAYRKAQFAAVAIAGQCVVAGR
ncbi:hypothetical protein G6F59_016305 [Rhizopus arrhizus]|nr:hypothetical protein G6F59_016305 [Rhizopus arrhizus]